MVVYLSPLLRRIFMGYLALGLLLAPAEDAFGWLWSPPQGLGSQTVSEEKLTKISEKILNESYRRNRDRADRKVLSLYKKGRAIWASSPANRSSQLNHGGKETLYEAGILLSAVLAYFDGTGRPGKTIPFLQEASRELRLLRDYKTWIEINKELIRRMGLVGRVDQKKQIFNEVMAFYRRLGLTDVNGVAPSTADSVVYLSWLGFVASQGGLVADAELVAGYDLFLSATTEGLRHWSWSPDVGFEFVVHFPEFLYAMAKQKDPRLPEAVQAYVTAMDWNRAADPVLVAAENQANQGHALGQSLFEAFDVRFDEIVGSNELPPTDRAILNSKHSKPEQSRFQNTSPYYRDLVLARVAWLDGQPEKALRIAEDAERTFKVVEKAYDRLDKEVFIADGLGKTSQSAKLLTARAWEDLGAFEQAAPIYADYIQWIELARESILVEERIHFFRGKALPAYLGLIRSLAHIASKDANDEAVSHLLASIDQVKGRQLFELMNVKAEPVPTSIQDVREALDERSGILLFQDLEASLLVLVATEDRTKLQLVDKPEGWDQHLFELRNRLAAGGDFDRQAFRAISDQLLGFAAQDLIGLEALYVLNDGALASIPPGVLSLPSGQLLGEVASITHLPSLSVLNSGADKIAVNEPRLLALADPQYMNVQSTRPRVSEEAIALRGATLLGYFDQLPETRDEVAQIAATFNGSSTLLLGKEASETRLKRLDLASYSHIHLATHGVIGNELPGLFEPALVMADEAEQDGLLTASEVAQLRLNAELTVLSACNTGNGEYFNGEGLVGMGRAFMVAGSKNVIVSLWPVESISTQILMEKLYEQMALGLGVSDSLFEAQRQLRNLGGYTAEDTVRGISVSGSEASPQLQEAASPASDRPYENPFFWSPFVLISAS
jgi:CHAT domain-containing protein